jgi:hypothetical protein
MQDQGPFKKYLAPCFRNLMLTDLLQLSGGITR